MGRPSNYRVCGAGFAPTRLEHRSSPCLRLLSQWTLCTKFKETKPVPYIVVFQSSDLNPLRVPPP
jgi:hypothetical protein